MTADFYPVFLYFLLVLIVSMVTMVATSLFASKRQEPVKFMPYESGIKTETHLLQQRFPLRHYLVALLFLVFDVEVIFLYPWAVVGKALGPLAFYEMAIFLISLIIGFIYVWRKGGLQWQ